jgi:hypothetical protein
MSVVVLDGHSTFKVVSPFPSYGAAEEHLKKNGYQEQSPGNWKQTIPGDVDNIVGRIYPLVTPN